MVEFKAGEKFRVDVARIQTRPKLKTVEDQNRKSALRCPTAKIPLKGYLSRPISYFVGIGRDRGRRAGGRSRSAGEQGNRSAVASRRVRAAHAGEECVPPAPAATSGSVLNSTR